MKVIFKQTENLPSDEIEVELRAKEYSTTVQDLENKLKQENNSFTINDNGRIKVIFWSEIIYGEMLGDYLKLILTHDTSVIFRETLRHFLSLAPNNVIRVSRGSIINIDYLKHIDPHISGNKSAHLINHHTVNISRRYWNQVKERILS